MIPSAIHLIVLLPVLLLSAGACVLLLSEAFLKGEDRRYQSVVAAIAALLALAAALYELGAGLPAGPLFKGAARGDSFQAFVAATIAAGLFLSVLVSPGFLRRHEAERGEYYGLMLFAAAGMMLLAMSDDLVMMFVALETMSLATYALAAWLRRSPRSAESAFKYFILGAFSSALFLYGAALVYGATGTTALSAVAQGARGPHPELLGPALALLVAAFGFKVAAVPFHMWAPDVYEGAPTPVTAFMAAGVKAAAFAALFRTLAYAFQGSPELWGPVVLVLALLTMVAGNLLALPQRNVKRMLAYSSIAHAGYLLTGVVAATGRTRTEAAEALLFYLLAYTVTAIGAFGVAGALEKKDADGATAWDLDRFSGLARRRPILAACMAAFLVSLAGVPPTAGFMGKLLVFKAAIDAGQVALAIVGVVTSAVGAYYYLRVVVYMYFRPPDGEPLVEERSVALDWGLGLACALVFVLGIGPGQVIELARRGAQLLF
ncbi:MAG TPA: NADH-quinone oxidoreductase subunit N [Myxococcales bacterium]|jgi:NADH-quinone oxidoreductase subunit N